MRLVALAAVLRSQCGLEKGPLGGKGVVFLSSCAGVDFHHALLGRVYEGIMEEPLLPCPLFRLHGNLDQVGLMRHCCGTPHVQPTATCTDLLFHRLDLCCIHLYMILTCCTVSGHTEQGIPVQF